jgi:Flp pilus assembly protein TadB
LRPPTDVAVAVKSGWILSMLPPVVVVLGLLYCANFASVILGEVRNTHTGVGRVGLVMSRTRWL